VKLEVSFPVFTILIAGLMILTFSNSLVFAQSVSETNTFTLTAFIGDERYEINFKTIAVNVINVEPQLNFDSIIINVVVLDTSGILEVTLDRDFLDSRYDGLDKEFVIVADSAYVDFVETETTSESRTIRIELPGHAEHVEIMGTSVGDKGKSESNITSSQLNVPPITVNTDRSSYKDGDKIIISGNVGTLSESNPKTPVTVIITGPDGNIIGIVQVTPDASGQFSHSIIAGGNMNTTGDYEVTAQYGTQKSTTAFSFTAAGFTPPPPPPPTPTPEPEPEPESEPEPEPTYEFDPEPVEETPESTYESAPEEIGGYMGNVGNNGETGSYTLEDTLDNAQEQIDNDISNPSSQNDDLSELIDENKKLREELERQGEQIDELNQEVDLLKQIIQSIQGFFSSIFG